MVWKVNKQTFMKKAWRFLHRNFYFHMHTQFILYFLAMFAVTEVVWQPWLRIYQANNKYRQIEYALEEERIHKKKLEEEEEEEDDEDEDDEEEEEEKAEGEDKDEEKEEDNDGDEDKADDGDDNEDIPSDGKADKGDLKNPEVIRGNPEEDKDDDEEEENEDDD